MHSGSASADAGPDEAHADAGAAEPCACPGPLPCAGARTLPHGPFHSAAAVAATAATARPAGLSPCGTSLCASCAAAGAR